MMRSMLIALVAALLPAAAVGQGPPDAILKRIRMVTVATPDVDGARIGMCVTSTTSPPAAAKSPTAWPAPGVC